MQLSPQIVVESTGLRIHWPEGAGEILHVVESTSPGVQGHNAPTVQRVEGIDSGVSKALALGNGGG